MELEKIKAILLATVCFFMACLNLWNIFKDWFDKKYQSKNRDKDKQSPTKEKEPIPDIIGKSKFQLKNEDYHKKESVKQEDPIKKEIAELKELVLQQSKMIEENKPFMSIPIKEVVPPDDEPVNLEEESVTVLSEKERSQFSTGTSIDEFELVVKTLKGKPITKEEETQVEQIIPKIEGSDIYNQFTRQIQGAEERVMAILNKIEENRQALSGNESGDFDCGKYIRE
ncbi:MAG: hypothetical protein LBU84_06750 [Prevotella sp.]|jgi:hypothetical protein|nr:hypothetical protein [Prevotella sp.]